MENTSEKFNLVRKGRNKWSGISAYKGSTIAFSPGISADTRMLKTGLDKKQQEKFEEKLNLQKGDLSPFVRPDGSIASDYWKNYKLEIPEKGLVLDTANPSDELAIILLKESSLTCGKGQLSAKALFELYNDKETAKTANNGRKERVDAYSYYANMSASEKYDFCISKGMQVTDTSPEIIDDLVGRELEKSPLSFNNWVSDDVYKKRVQLYRYVYANAVRKAGSSFYYNDVQLGYNEKSAIEFLDRVSNQKVKEGILQKYQAYKKENSLEVEKEPEKN